MWEDHHISYRKWKSKRQYPTESSQQKHLAWKRPLRSSNPAVNLTLPNPYLMSHFPFASRDNQKGNICSLMGINGKRLNWNKKFSVCEYFDKISIANILHNKIPRSAAWTFQGTALLTKEAKKSLHRVHEDKLNVHCAWEWIHTTNQFRSKRLGCHQCNKFPWNTFSMLT